MKKIIAAVLFAGCANVAVADPDVGCGLGSMIWAGQQGMLPKILAATTNGIYGNQTFGITFGTLGCSRDGVVTSKARLGMFTGSNLDRLARDMSVGEGEALNVLAELMGVEAADKATFFQATKTNFDRIFAAENETAGQMLSSLQQVMAEDSVLVVYSA